jgi:hypothetical protein
VGKKSWNFWWVRGGQKKLKFLMCPGWATWDFYKITIGNKQVWLFLMHRIRS